MKDILVLTNAEDEWLLISKALSDAGNIRRAPDLNAALTLHTPSLPFDLIMADIELLGSPSGHVCIQFGSIHLFSSLCCAHGPNTRQAIGGVVKAGCCGLPAISGQGAGYPSAACPALNRSRSKDFELDYLRDRFWENGMAGYYPV